ncbi:MAG TPA: hypothetical protein VKK79_16070 [Candidatus Lokiarchaeia archaeon]|nr:hypothetical protein [Candidatus Lokiarchaeia archaeon]
MNSILIGAIVVVTFALAFYSIAVIAEQRKSAISKVVLLFITTGVCCDVTSTILMIVGSNNIPFTIHGVLGYTALAVMLVDTGRIWRFWRKNGGGTIVPRKLHLYTRIAYCWWIIAYIAGAIISIAYL